MPGLGLGSSILDEWGNELEFPFAFRQSRRDVESYERLERGEFDELENLRGRGHLLIAFRIAQGLSQREIGGSA